MRDQHTKSYLLLYKRLRKAITFKFSDI